MSYLRQAYLLDTYGPRLNMEQLAHALGYVTNTIYNKISRGTLGVKIYQDDGKHWADFAAVAEYLETKAKEAKSEATRA